MMSKYQNAKPKLFDTRHLRSFPRRVNIIHHLFWTNKHGAIIDFSLHELSGGDL